MQIQWRIAQNINVKLADIELKLDKVHMFKIYKMIMQEYGNVFSGRLVEEVLYKSEG